MLLEEIGLSHQDLISVVKKHFHSHDDLSYGKFQIISTNIRSETVPGFGADHYFIDVKIRKKKVSFLRIHPDPVEVDCSFFVKTVPANDFNRKYVDEIGVFRKEIRLLQYLIPRLEDITIEDYFWSPRCYFVKEDTIIVLEDLIAAGFEVTDEILLDEDHLKVALKAISKMHGSSFVLEERLRTPLNKLYPTHLEEIAFPENENSIRRQGIQGFIEGHLELIRRIYVESPNLNDILDIFPGLIWSIFGLAKPSTTLRNVINHSDLWSHNILFRYEEAEEEQAVVHEELCQVEVHRVDSSTLINSGANACRIELQRLDSRTLISSISDPGPPPPKPVDCRLIDFQFSRYAPPAWDLTTLLFTSTEKKWRDQHFDDLLEFYYASLKTEMARFECDVEDVFSFAELKRSFGIYKLAGLIEIILFNQVGYMPRAITDEMLASQEIYEKVFKEGRKQQMVEAFETDEFYRERITEYLREIIDNYILDKEVLISTPL